VVTHNSGTSFARSSQTLSADDEKTSIIIDLYGNVGDGFILDTPRGVRRLSSLAFYVSRKPMHHQLKPTPKPLSLSAVVPTVS
jgi:hypothetical protein